MKQIKEFLELYPETGNDATDDAITASFDDVTVMLAHIDDGSGEAEEGLWVEVKALSIERGVIAQRMWSGKIMDWLNANPGCMIVEIREV